MWFNGEKAGCRDLLSRLSDADIDSLIETSTQGKIKEDTRRGKIEAILTFSDSADSLLRRKKITKDVLLNYAFSKGICESASVRKQELQDSIIQYWKRQVTNNNNGNESSQQARAKTPPISPASSRPWLQMVSNYSPTHMNNQTYTMQVNNIYVNSPPVATKTEDSDRVMAVNFVEWFYKMVNSLHPNSGTHQKEFGPQHFWENVELHVNITLSGHEQNRHVIGSEQVVEMIESFVTKERLLFNPNTSNEGILIRSDPHGLKMILVSGSLHKENSCVGVFQQSFGLVRNPLARDSWKIKVSFLKMKGESVQTCPTLQMTGDVNFIEGLTIKALEGALTS